MPEIKAAVLRKRGGPLDIESLELEGPRNDEILVQNVSSGICHTDLGLIDSWDGTTTPVVLGHEGAGIVVEVGEKVKSVKPGDHVVLSYQSCGKCLQCLSSRPWSCQHFYELNFGFKRLDGTNAMQNSGVYGHFFGQSSFATHSLVTERNIVTVPEDLELEMLSPLGCGLQTGAGTVMNTLAVPEGASIAIFGTGAVGLAAVMAARITGAFPVIGVDRNPARLELARELGATHVIDNRRDDISSFISAITGSGVDYVLEITGDLESTAINVLNSHGTLAIVAGAGAPANLPDGKKAVSVIQGSSVPQEFIPEMINYYRAGLFPFDRLLKFYDFSDIDQAITDARLGNAIKPVLRISSR
jgi:aryl-alcohol dehydrogenase